MAWINIGASYFAQEDYGLARRAFTHAVDGIAGNTAFRTADARARYNRGLVLMRQNANADAAQDFEATLLVFPDHMAAHANLGFIYRNSRRFDEQALMHLGRALELDPDPERRKGLEEAIEFIEARAREAAESSPAESTPVVQESLPDTTGEEASPQP
jgi:tetratricopeptide (TPR) repeat protein